MDREKMNLLATKHGLKPLVVTKKSKSIDIESLKSKNLNKKALDFMEC